MKRHDTPSSDNISLVNEHILAKMIQKTHVSGIISTKPVNSNNK